MSLSPRHRRVSVPSALRRAGGAALVLGGIGGVILLGLQPGPWSGGPAGPVAVPGHPGALGDNTAPGAGKQTGSSVRWAAVEGWARTDPSGRPQGGSSASDPGTGSPWTGAGQGVGVGVAGEGPVRGPDGEAQADAALLAAWERLEQRITTAIARARESVVALEYTALDSPAGTRRVATGVVINNRGEILSVRIDPPPTRPAPGTGKNLAPIVARDAAGRRHAAQWLAADPETGLTLLRVSPRAVRPIRIARDGPRLGSQVFVVGNPFGMGHSVSRGHVAGLDRALELGRIELGGLIQVQAPLYPGDSGAAVLDLRGDWLGLIRSGLAIPGSGIQSNSDAAPDAAPASVGSDATLTGVDSPPNAEEPTTTNASVPRRHEPDAAFGFAIPTGDALWIAEQLHTHGRVDRAYLGVRLEPVSSAPAPIGPPDPGPPVPPVAIPRAAVRPSQVAPPARRTARMGSVDGGSEAQGEPPIGPGGGALVRHVIPGTPADRAGIRPGDLLVALDGQPIRSPHDLIDRLDRIPARATIRLRVDRADPPLGALEISLQTAGRPGAVIVGSGTPPPLPGSAAPRASVPVTPTASRSVPGSAIPSGSTAPPGPEANSGAAPSPRTPAPVPSIVSPERRANIPVEATAAIPAPAWNELRLHLPRAIVDRLEHLERRLQKLETFSTPAPNPRAAPGRAVDAGRTP